MENPSAHTSHTHLTSSYLTHRSHPPTPSILSRSTSRTSDSKSPLTLTSLAPTPGYHHGSHTPGTKTPTTHPTPDSQSWLLQTASLLQQQTQESKGQSWLMTRTSSTLLHLQPPSLSPGSEEADDEYSPLTARSHTSSRYASRNNSRRASRADLAMTSHVVLRRGDLVTGLEEEFGEGPDFVDEEGAEVDVDEGEMKKVVWGRVGGWVDWAVGWMDFRRDEGENELGGAEEEVEGRRDEGKTKESKDLKEDTGKRDVATEEVAEEIPPIHGESGWDDAKWLLSVATKLIW